MKLLNMSDWGVKRACATQGLLPKNRIGRGAFAAVYSASPKSVKKLTLDDATQQFLRFYADTIGLPRVIEDHGYVGETSLGDSLYLLEIEKLTPLSESSIEMRRLARQVLKVADTAYSTASTSYGRGVSHVRVREGASLTTAETLARNKTLPKHVRDAFGRVFDFLTAYRNCGYGVDIHLGNVMVRGQKLVMNDVVLNAEMLHEAQMAALVRARRW